MNIPTENIDEWCFRYLEKDLSDEEYAFFEKELKNNSTLAKQFSYWKQTVIKSESLTQIDFSVTNNLFRYRNQFLFSLIEFVLVTSLVFFIASNTTKEVQTTKTLNSSPANISLSTGKNNKDSAFIEDVKLNKPVYVNLLLDQQPDSVSAFQNDEIKNIQPDTIASNTNQTLFIPEERNQKDSVKVSTDTTAVQKKSTQKKNTTRRKYRGSRLIPINDDL